MELPETMRRRTGRIVVVAGLMLSFTILAQSHRNHVNQREWVRLGEAVGLSVHVRSVRPSRAWNLSSVIQWLRPEEWVDVYVDTEEATHLLRQMPTDPCPKELRIYWSKGVPRTAFSNRFAAKVYSVD